MNGEKIEFALLGHPSNFDHFVKMIEMSDGAEKAQRLSKHEKLVSKMIEWMPSYVTRHRPVIHLANGPIEGRLIVCPFIPSQATRPNQIRLAREKIIQGCELAKQMGARVVALGGFTSILQSVASFPSHAKIGPTITSGGSLTAALAIAQLNAVLDAVGSSIDQHVVAVLGATGDVGRNCALLVGAHAKKLILVARNGPRLQKLRSELPRDVDVELATDAHAALRAKIIIAVTSATEPLLKVSDLQAGAIVCDVGYPKTMIEGASTREDVLVFLGGLAKLPNFLDVDNYTNLPAKDLLFGCFAEGIVLAAQHRDQMSTVAQADTGQFRARALLSAADELGIRSAPIYRGKTIVSGSEIAAFRRFVGTPQQ
jgi:predicted amino acid dehydrogenase